MHGDGKPPRPSCQFQFSCIANKQNKVRNVRVKSPHRQTISPIFAGCFDVEHREKSHKMSGYPFQTFYTLDVQLIIKKFLF